MFTKLFFLLFLTAFYHCQCNNILKSRGFSLNLVRATLVENSSRNYVFPNAIAFQNGLFLLAERVAIGTPGTMARLYIDMSSSLTWTQCTPCTNCFSQTYPLFNPHRSTSYKKLSSDHDLKRFFLKSKINGDYIFKLTFANVASSSGIASVDKFSHFRKGAISTISKGIVFGCVNYFQWANYYDKKKFDNRSYTGVMGMNRSPLSLVGQMGSKSLQRFSYCLPKFNYSSTIQTAAMRLGDAAIIEKTNLHKTNFTSDSFPQYHVHLLNISINTAAGRMILSLPKKTLPSSCELEVQNEYSIINIEAYNYIHKAIEKYFKSIYLPRLYGPPNSGGGLCYVLRRGFNQYPKMVLNFQGANFEIGHEKLFVFRRDRFCLALMVWRHKRIVLGAHQMQNVRFIYDVGNDKLLFGEEDCSKDL